MKPEEHSPGETSDMEELYYGSSFKIYKQDGSFYLKLRGGNVPGSVRLTAKPREINETELSDLLPNETLLQEALEQDDFRWESGYQVIMRAGKKVVRLSASGKLDGVSKRFFSYRTLEGPVSAEE